MKTIDECIAELEKVWGGKATPPPRVNWCARCSRPDIQAKRRARAQDPRPCIAAPGSALCVGCQRTELEARIEAKRVAAEECGDSVLAKRWEQALQRLRATPVGEPVPAAKHWQETDR